jgi:hypothetical protein
LVSSVSETDGEKMEKEMEEGTEARTESNSMLKASHSASSML